MLLQCSFLTDTDCIIHAYQYSSNIILFIIDLSLVILRLLWRQKTGSGREGTRGRNGDRCGNGLGGKKKRQDFISQPHPPPTDTTFPFPTLSWAPLYTHTLYMPPGSLTPKIAPDVPSRVFGHRATARWRICEILKNICRAAQDWSGWGLERWRLNLSDFNERLCDWLL